MKKTVWVVDDDVSITWVLERGLSRAGFQVVCFDRAEAVINAMKQQSFSVPDVVLTDIRMDGVTGLELTRQITAQHKDLPIIMMTAFGDLDSAVDAYKAGVFEYITKPFDMDEVVTLVNNATDKNKRIKKTQITSPKANSRSIVGESAAIQEVFRLIGRLSNSEMTVLIRGESGTGKELVAQAIYQNSPRSDREFVAINTAAIPAELLESELFGHERGAFTGAHQQHIGRFEQSDGGTLFLDEIGDMPAVLQTRLLRVLSEGSFYRVGGREEVNVDVRVIAATNQNLERLVETDVFRSDLFHRLNVIAINLPSLSDRPEDITILLNHFFSQAAAELGVEQKHCSVEALVALMQYHWPGNVRELENLTRRLTVLSPSENIQKTDLPLEINNTEKSYTDWSELLSDAVDDKLQAGEGDLMGSLGGEFEAILIKAALSYTRGHKQNAAVLLGWGRNTLTRKLKQLELE